MPIVVCNLKECAYNKLKVVDKDNKYRHCVASAIGIKKSGCDTYLVLPPEVLKKMAKVGKRWKIIQWTNVGYRKVNL